MFKKIFLTSVIIILLSFSVVILGVFKFTEDIINEEVISVHKQSIENDALMVEQIIDRAINYLLLLSINENVQSTFVTINSKDSEYIEGTTDILEDESDKLIYYSGYKAHFFPFSSDNRVYTKESDNLYLKNYDVQSVKWYEETIARNGKISGDIVWVGGIKYLRLSTLVYNIENWDEHVGIIAVDINFHNISASFGITPLGRTGSVYLLDDENILLYPYNVQTDFTVDVIEEIKEGPKILFNSYLGIYDDIEPLNWKIIGYLPVVELKERSSRMRVSVLIIALITIFASLIAELIFSYISSKPIRDLAAVMKKRDFTDEVEIHKNFSGDVTILYESYNYMINQFNDLIEKVYKSTIKEKDTELKLLQSQINPHFLYNTLDSISWLAMKYKADDIYSMVHSLGTMLRFSLNAGEDSISIRNELKQVESYIEIQKYRYDNSFNVEYSVDESIMEVKIIRLILQPLVENALIHGFETFEGKKRIVITGKMTNQETAILEVKNTGNPVNINRINRILNDRDYDSKSYGIKNVNERLTKTFGNNFGLTFNIEPEHTVAKIIIPLGYGSDQGFLENSDNESTGS